MKFKLKISICIYLLAAFCISCEKILELKDEGKFTPNQIYVDDINDFEEILNNSSFITSNYLIADLMSDDIELTDLVLNTSADRPNVRAYLWEKEFWLDHESDDMYSLSYNKIMKYNWMIEEVSSFTDVDESRKVKLLAEVKLQRAWEYFQLTNIYGKSYDESTSKSDLAVPLVLTTTEVRPKRATIFEVYEQIIADLDYAISSESFVLEGPNILRPGKLAAYALLARVYLYMGNYAKANENAEIVLQEKSSVLDYNITTVTFPRNLTSIQNVSTEVLFHKHFRDEFYVKANSSSLPYLTSSLSNLYGTTDLRLTKKTILSQSKRMLKILGSTEFVLDYGIKVPEMMLIKAEYLARNNSAKEAIQIVNELRKFRFSPANYKELDINSPDALQIVLDERRRELFMHGGIRLFDLKRLQKEGLINTIIERRSTVKPDSVLAIISPKSNRFVVPFSQSLLYANPNIIQNER